MVFIADLETKPTTPDKPEPVDVEHAKQLATALRAKRKIMRSFSIQHWAVYFKKLRKEGVTDKRVHRVLQWYTLNISGRYIPQAYSGKAFYQKFLQIEDAMRRAGVPTQEISKEAQTIASRLRRKHWPNGSGDQLDSAVQVSLENYSQLNRKELRSRLPPKLRSAFDHFVGLGKLGPPVSFVESWMVDIWESVKNWEAWSGDLMALVFDWDGERINKFGRAWMREYGGSPKWWDELKGHIDACRETE